MNDFEKFGGGKSRIPFDLESRLQKLSQHVAGSPEKEEITSKTRSILLQYTKSKDKELYDATSKAITSVAQYVKEEKTLLDIIKLTNDWCLLRARTMEFESTYIRLLDAVADMAQSNIDGKTISNVIEVGKKYLAEQNYQTLNIVLIKLKEFYVSKSTESQSNYILSRQHMPSSMRYMPSDSGGSEKINAYIRKFDLTGSRTSVKAENNPK